MKSLPLDPIWDSLVRTIAGMITLAPDYVVIQVYGDDGPDGGPYVQTIREEDGHMTLEAASNQFLDISLSDAAVSELMKMGWNDPEPHEGMPNYFCLIGPDKAPFEIAEFLAQTLIGPYNVSSSAVFEMAPQELFVELLMGEFGQSTGMQFARDGSDPREVGR
jgi:hypothetical protein